MTVAARFCWERVPYDTTLEAVRIGTEAGLLYVALVLVVVAGAIAWLLKQES